MSPNVNQWLPRLVALYTLLFRVVDKALWPFVDLALRLWLAHTFFISGMMKMMSPLTDASVAAAAGASCKERRNGVVFLSGVDRTPGFYPSKTVPRPIL